MPGTAKKFLELLLVAAGVAEANDVFMSSTEGAPE
jgi:hypothetical protein